MTGVDNSKEESANFCRLISVVVDVGSEVLRDVLLHRMKPRSLEAVLQASANTINYLLGRKILFAEQHKLLMKVPPDAEEFDISLLCVLFRNICPNVPPPTLGWNTRHPDVNDLSLAADLQRLKNIRNSVYAHKSSTKVTNADFEPLWIDLSQIIYRISKHGSGKHQNIKQRIQILRNENLDPRSERDRMLKIFIKWQEQDEEHKKMILQRMDNQDVVQQNNNQLLQDIHQRVVTNSQVGPGICTCRALIKVPEDEAAVHPPDQVITGNSDSIPADQNWVCLIKMYTWLKEEMTKKTANCIASQLLGQINEDHVESIELSSRRRMAVDRLLKHVLQRNPTYPTRLKTFLEKIECHCEPADRFRQYMLNALPTEKEIKDCLDRNTNSLSASRCNETFCDQERFKLHEKDKQVIHDNIKDIMTIDMLNNGFLSKFHFSLVEHERVCDSLYKEHFDVGATRLIEIMEKCSKMVAYCFCDTLKLLEDKCCIVEGLVQDLQLREKYCLTEVNQNETAGHIADEHCLFFHMASHQERLKRWCLQTLDFIVTQITHGSIIIHMRPNSEASWKRLEALCSSGQITGLLKTIFEDENIRMLMPDAENGVSFNIYREADPNTGDAVYRMAILTLEITSERDKAIQGSFQADQNPLTLNMDLFSEELEICDELIQLLKEKELIPENTEEKLKETTSRASEIICLLRLISSPERGYEAIKEYLIGADKDLLGQLVKREENRTQRKLIYTDRQKIPIREFNVSADSVDSKPFGDGPRVQDIVDAKPFKGGGSLGTLGFKPEQVVTSEDFFSDKYKMSYPNRGKALIINNRVFDRRLNLGERSGTDVDAIAIHQRFSEMGFEVEVFNNLSVKDMVQVLHKAASDDFNLQSDCFVCAILTHGKEGVVYGIDDKVEVKILLEPFKGNNCKGLVGKPKIFFIQACQGVQFDAGVGVNTTDAEGDLPMDQDTQVHKIPSEADFLVAYSVVPGYFSWRNRANGSWFIQALSEVLAKHWKSLDLLTMMTRVNKKVAYDFESRTGKEFMNQKKQIPCITSMLTKEVLFTEK